MGRGAKDYKSYMITPQRKMCWATAVSYMLQSPGNIVYSTNSSPYLGTVFYKIDEGVFWYRYKSWEKNGCFPKNHWAQVGVSGVCSKFFTALKYHERDDAGCDQIPSDLDEADFSTHIELEEKDKVIGERFDKIERRLAEISKKLKR